MPHRNTPFLRVGFVICSIMYGLVLLSGCGTDSRQTPQNKAETTFTKLRVLEAAARDRRSNIQVTQQGKVQRLLPDDTVGSRHQRFIVKLSNGQTVLVSHNIDLAPRIPQLAAGNAIIFNGEYEWNKRGGVIHWTHHDPAGKHEDGWIKYRGNIYQ